MGGIVREIFGLSHTEAKETLKRAVIEQTCPFLNRKCIKCRKSAPDIAIGTCTVSYGKNDESVVICPHRFLEKRQIFMDAIHLLSFHEPGNELHVVPELSIPGGSLDYCLASVKHGRVVDFAGIEIQTLDTTGTVWPARQRLLRKIGIQDVLDSDVCSEKTYGMNWKMTAKTILVQLHHKIETFDHIGKKLALVIQDSFLRYMQNEFSFSHLSSPAIMGEPMHFHAYSLLDDSARQNILRMTLRERLSTNVEGIASCLGLQAEAKVELQEITNTIQGKISTATHLSLP